MVLYQMRLHVYHWLIYHFIFRYLTSPWQFTKVKFVIYVLKSSFLSELVLLTITLAFIYFHPPFGLCYSINNGSGFIVSFGFTRTESRKKNQLSVSFINCQHASGQFQSYSKSVTMNQLRVRICHSGFSGQSLLCAPALLVFILKAIIP